MHPSLSDRLETLSRETTLGDGSPCHTIAASAVIRLTDETGLTGRMVEIAALKKQILPDRYLRNRRTLSLDDQIRLLESSVCIVGLGGLGGLVTETLARMGIGRLHLIDGDVFEAHNLNRQLLSGIDSIGKQKTETAQERVSAINPGLEVSTAAAYLTPENADALVAANSLVVDCLDNIKSRFTLQSAAKRAGIPMVSAAVAGMCGHVTTIFPDDKGLETIFGSEKQLTVTKGAETELGCLAPAVNLIASLECAEVLNVLLNRGKILRNRMLMVDLTDSPIGNLP
jgi:molybdopterin/thiamine biosynthesis adenylyltransferase